MLATTAKPLHDRELRHQFPKNGGRIRMSGGRHGSAEHTVMTIGVILAVTGLLIPRTHYLIPIGAVLLLIGLITTPEWPTDAQ